MVVLGVGDGAVLTDGERADVLGLVGLEQEIRVDLLDFLPELLVLLVGFLVLVVVGLVLSYVRDLFITVIVNVSRRSRIQGFLGSKLHRLIK
jgi:hypothetical protein